MPEKPKIPPDDRTRPPSDDEWPHVWTNLERSQDAWPLLAPFVALYKNWKALLLVLAALMAWNGPRLIEILQAWAGIAP